MSQSPASGSRDFLLLAFIRRDDLHWSAGLDGEDRAHCQSPDQANHDQGVRQPVKFMPDMPVRRFLRLAPGDGLRAETALLSASAGLVVRVRCFGDPRWEKSASPDRDVRLAWPHGPAIRPGLPPERKSVPTETRSPQGPSANRNYFTPAKHPGASFHPHPCWQALFGCLSTIAHASRQSAIAGSPSNFCALRLRMANLISR